MLLLMHLTSMILLLSFLSTQSSKLFGLIIVLSVRFVISYRGMCICVSFKACMPLFSAVPFLHRVNFVNAFAQCPCFPELYNFQDSFFVCYNVYL